MQIPRELDIFRIEFKEAVKELCEKHNISIKAGTMSYESDGSAFSFKVEVKNETVGGLSIEQHDFEKHCRLYGFEKSDYKRKVVINKVEHQLIGFKLKARKSPCIIRDPKGSNYVVSIDTAKRCLV